MFFQLHFYSLQTGGNYLPKLVLNITVGIEHRLSFRLFYSSLPPGPVFDVTTHLSFWAQSKEVRTKDYMMTLMIPFSIVALILFRPYIHKNTGGILYEPKFNVLKTLFIPLT